MTTMRGDEPAGRWGPDACFDRAWLLVLLVAPGLVNCSSPNPVAPPQVTAVRLEGRTVSWTTSQSALGAVRWGAHAGSIDHVAYPAAAASEDRALVTEHAVPILDAGPGDSVYLQVLARTADGTLVAGELHAFRLAGTLPMPALFTWTMIDVGFGDAHLLTLPTTHNRVLIDAGERRDAANVERFLDDATITRLDAVVMTHVHEDHIGGMVGDRFATHDGVVGTREVGGLIEGPPPSAPRSAYDELVALCAARGIPRRRVAPGDDDATNPALAWDPGVRVRVLHAGGGREVGGLYENDWINNDSIVMRVTFGDVSLMMGGDAESPVETKLLADGAPLAASVLKVHHHGSLDASDAGYLDAVRPRVGLIPMTRYESEAGTLPSTVVLQRLRDRRVDIYSSDTAEPLDLVRTGDSGVNVTVLTDGKSYEVAVAGSASRHWPPETALPLSADRSLP